MRSPPTTLLNAAAAALRKEKTPAWNEARCTRKAMRAEHADPMEVAEATYSSIIIASLTIGGAGDAQVARMVEKRKRKEARRGVESRLSTAAAEDEDDSLDSCRTSQALSTSSRR